MEYLEGDTLAQRIKKGALPLDQVLKYAIEVADEAHRHGVVHRDLKPGNIMLTSIGAKLLDFGVAKIRRNAGKLRYRPGSYQRVRRRCKHRFVQVGSLSCDG